ncbi:hypothetical protein HF290_16975 [Acidithiobacillus ferrooxidans]|uniref:hypothetical protein n=1 Tax=Acidithiobacillus ferrooxidans TaxID=920 RepID=UPI001C066B27|nr:hypothetical protein [Acidithiobacillus ferrooxidans]MBU2862009.1 hypothetical protein [Acidithiobacillus ferrooxidans]
MSRHEETQRRTLSGRASRNKGGRGERELFSLLSDRLGFVVTRNLTQTRDAGCDSLSVPGFAIECKRVESSFQSAWMRQAIEAIHDGHEIPVVFYRQSRHPWRAAFRCSDLLNHRAYTGLAHLDLDDAATFMREMVAPVAAGRAC